MTTPNQPGWYDDPHDSNAQRYWDGQDWTPHRQRKPASRPARQFAMPSPPQQSSQPANLPPPPPANLPPPPPPNLQSPPPANLPPPPPYAQQQQWSPPGGAPSQRSRTPFVIAGVLAVVAVVLAGAGVSVYKFVLTGHSDEDQIRALFKKVTADENNADGPGLTTLVCSAARGGTASSEELRDNLNENGSYATSLTDIHVTGDRATATVTTTRSKMPDQKATETASFVKENGSWKLCPDAE